MTLRRLSCTRAMLAVVFVAAAWAVALGSPAVAATKPVIGAVGLYSNSEFRAASAVVWGATGVAICVSGKCVKAYKQRPGYWTAPASRLPLLRAGQRRQVVVFAVNSSGQFAYVATNVTVR